MGNMLGKKSKIRQSVPWWRYCCQGHDGVTPRMVKKDKKSQRQREKREWKSEA